MEYQIQFCFLLVLMIIVMGFVLPKSKVLFVFQAAVMWFLMALNNGGADYQANEAFYMSANVGSIKKFFLDSGIYQGLCMFFRHINLDFPQAYSILCTVALLLVFFKVYHTAKKQCLVLSLCMLYPFVDFIIQKRNFLIVPVLMYIFPFLFKKTKTGDFIYCAGCVLCGLIHVTGYVYLLFFFVYKILSIRKIKKYFLLNILLLLGAEVLCFPFLPNIASLFFPKAKVTLYFYSMLSSKAGAMYTICAHLLFCGMVEYVCLRCRKRNSNPELTDELKYLFRISLLFIPLYFYGAVFARIYIYMLPYAYIVFSNVFFVLKRPVKSSFIFYGAVLSGISLISIINYGLYHSGFIRLVIPLFENNILIRLF